MQVAKQVNAALGPNTSLTMVGHSLGGGLADAGAFATNRRAVTFNAAGLNLETELQNGAGNYTSQMENYAVKGELITTLNNSVGPMPEVPGANFFLPPAPVDVHDSPLQLHSMVSVLHALGESPP